MPLKKKISRTPPRKGEELRRKLAEEWRNPRDDGQPVIIVEEQEAAPIHIYVIWDEWSDISSQTDRSEIIMDTLDHLTDLPDDQPEKSGFPDLSRVSVAMGLTTDEAKRMGIQVD